jgi:hypothetical protein
MEKCSFLCGGIVYVLYFPCHMECGHVSARWLHSTKIDYVPSLGPRDKRVTELQGIEGGCHQRTVFRSVQIAC